MEKKIDFTNTEILIDALRMYVHQKKREKKYFLIDRAKALINRIQAKEQDQKINNNL